VYQILTAHGGLILAASQPGVRVAFTVELPGGARLEARAST
jgi:hypothetical protein